MNACQADSMFSIKTFMKEFPYTMQAYAFLIVWFIGGYTTLILERGIDDESGMDFKNYWNCLWNVIVTMTTVGYGDIYPVTPFGRVNGMVMCLFGVFEVSLVVVSLSNILEMSKPEEKVKKITINYFSPIYY